MDHNQIPPHPPHWAAEVGNQKMWTLPSKKQQKTNQCTHCNGYHKSKKCLIYISQAAKNCSEGCYLHGEFSAWTHLSLQNGRKRNSNLLPCIGMHNFNGQTCPLTFQNTHKTIFILWIHHFPKKTNVFSKNKANLDMEIPPDCSVVIDQLTQLQCKLFNLHLSLAQRINWRIYKRKMKLFIDSLCSCSPTNWGDVTDFSVTENFHVSFSEWHVAVFREVFPALLALGCP